MGAVKLVVGRRADHHDEVPGLPVLRGRGAPPRLKDLVQIGRRDRANSERPNVPASSNRVPGPHDLLNAGLPRSFSAATLAPAQRVAG
jgi:hypothetical protein